MQKYTIFFYGNHNLNAQFTPKPEKQPQIHLIHFVANILAWTLPEPHISTSENLHAKRTPVFSAILRPKMLIFRIFLRVRELWHLTQKIYETTICQVPVGLSYLSLCFLLRIIFLPAFFGARVC